MGLARSLALFAIIIVCRAVDTPLAHPAQVTLVPERTTILPLTPLGCAVTISNTSSAPLAVEASGWTSYRTRADIAGAEWDTYMGFTTVLPMDHMPRMLCLAPAASFEDTIRFHVAWGGRPIFRDQGRYLVQAGTPFGQSPAVPILVEAPAASATAVARLYDTKLYFLFDAYTARCFFEQQAHASDPISVESLTSALVAFRELPGSQPYADWLVHAEFVLQRIRIAGLPEAARAASAQRLLRDAQAAVGRLSSPPRDLLLLNLADLHAEGKQPHTAVALLQQVLAAHADGYFRVRAAFLQDYYLGRAVYR